MHRAIETRYKNRRFRSRLEARWAVLFDSLEIIWEYEPEGFELGGGLRYLPDFRFREREIGAEMGSMTMWVEIKPDMPTELERRKLKLLCEQTYGEGMFLVGQPDQAFALVCGYDREYYPRERRWWDCDHISCCRNDGSPLPSRPDAAIRAALSARFEFGENGGRA